MGKSVYLVDYATVSYHGLYGISNVNSGDEIVIFYYSDIDTVRDIVSEYENKGVVLKYFKFEKSKLISAVFMITAYAGYAAASDDVERIVIISANENFNSFFNVIDNLNPEVDIILEHCIHNVFNPENKKPINTTGALVQTINAMRNMMGTDSDEQKKTNQKPSVQPKDEAKSDKTAEKNKKHEDLKKQTKNQLKGLIPDETLDCVSEVFVKCMEDECSGNEFIEIIEKKLAGKSIIYGKNEFKKIYKKIRASKDEK